MSLSNEEKRRRFEKALACGGNTHDVDDVVALVKAGKAQYWEHGDGIVVSEIHEFPKLKAIHFWVVSVIVAAIVWRSRMTCCRGHANRDARSRRPAGAKVGAACWRQSVGGNGGQTS